MKDLKSNKRTTKTKDVMPRVGAVRFSLMKKNNLGFRDLRDLGSKSSSLLPRAIWSPPNQEQSMGQLLFLWLLGPFLNCPVLSSITKMLIQDTYCWPAWFWSGYHCCLGKKTSGHTLWNHKIPYVWYRKYKFTYIYIYTCVYIYI